MNDFLLFSLDYVSSETHDRSASRLFSSYLVRKTTVFVPGVPAETAETGNKNC